MNSLNAAAEKVVLITGASTGIGKAIAQTLLQQGFRVYGTTRKDANADERSGVKMMRLDVTQEDSIDRVVEEIIAREGRIDVLINNAGYGVFGGAEESSIEQAKHLFDTNFFGILRMTQKLLPHMRKQGQGQIINISSVLGFLPAPYMALYAATKHAVEGYSESLDHELRHLGIRVTLIEPAYTKTAFEQNMVEADTPMPVYTAEREHMTKLVTQSVTTGDSPEVVALAVLKAVKASSPDLRYTAGALAGRLNMLRRYAPRAIVDKALRKEMKIPLKTKHSQ